MRVLILSDSHGDLDALQHALRQQPQARHVVFLGDGLDDVEDVRAWSDDRIWHTVRGNNDWRAGGEVPGDALVCLEGYRLFLTHGHRYHIKWGSEDAIRAARERQAHVLLFGHTHTPMTDYQDGLYLFNPGSLAYGGTYGVLDLTPSGIMPLLMGVNR